MSGFQYSRGDDKDWDLWRLPPRNDQFSSSSQFHSLHSKQTVGYAVGDVSTRQRYTRVNHNDNSDSRSKIVGAVTGITNILTEYIISHPFVVLRRQCQVNRKSINYHLAPFSLIPFAFRLQSKQGIGTLWKGVPSVLLTRGMLISAESILSEISSLPRELSTATFSFDNLTKHLLLKGFAVALVTPFLCSSCIETVQSTIASENPGIFDCIKEGLFRSTLWSKGSTRILPIWLLASSTVFYQLSHYIIFKFTKSTSLFLFKLNDNNETDSSSWKSQINEMFTNFWSLLVADVITFPLQTILFRLYLQGTRTIIDNVDQTSAVIPVISDYDSPIDCYNMIIKEEGSSGLFKGFGALIIQYSIHYSLLRLTKFLLVKFVPSLES